MNDQNSLVVVGNGFDLAHGYRTTYEAFQNKVHNGALDDFRELWEKYFTTDCLNNDICLERKNACCFGRNDVPGTWMDFELGICSMTNNMFHQYMREEDNYKQICIDTERLNDAFRKMRLLFSDYLREELIRGNKDFVKRVEIEPYISKRQRVICFNYTDVVEHYSNNVSYIHGSVKENYIVLGYDLRFEPCLEEEQFMKWNKANERELLFLHRIMNKAIDVGSDLQITPNLVKEYREFQDAIRYHWPEGAWHEGKNNSILIKSIHRSYELQQERFVQSLKDIKEIVVIGHSILSDTSFFNILRDNCARIERFVLFCYLGEENYEIKINERLRYLEKWVDKIELVFY